MKYYAEERMSGLCVAFHSEQRRDQWVLERNQNALSRYNEMKADYRRWIQRYHLVSGVPFPEYNASFFPIEAEEAMRRYPPEKILEYGAAEFENKEER